LPDIFLLETLTKGLIFLKFLLSFFLFTSLLFSQDAYSLRVAYGKSTKSNLGNVLIGDITSDVADLRTLSLDGGYLLTNSLFNLPIDLYVKSSLSYFDEANRQDDIYEMTLYIKLYYNFKVFDEKLRFGFGEGGSYTSGILFTEYSGAEASNDNTSKYLNYLDISLDVDIGKLFAKKELEGTYVGWLIKHRSGIYGLINDVKHGGSNYNCLMIEKKF